MHHAYIYYGSLSELPALATAARALFHFKKQNDPDVQVLSFEKFGIEEAREIKDLNSFRSLSGRALYIVGVGAITTEAQQALLKLFEEPQEGSIYVLLAPHGSIIPTLRSRFAEYPGQLSHHASQKVLGSPVSRKAALGPDHFVQKFLSASGKARSDEIVKLLKDEEGARERVREFLVALESSLHTAVSKSKNKKELYEGLEDIAKVRSYTNDRSPSLKMLLEHLAVSLPILK